MFVELTSREGLVGLGEAAPSARYDENADAAVAFFELVNPYQVAFSDVAGSMRYVDALKPGNFAAKGALNMALLDGAARLAGKPIYDYLGLGFQEGKHVTSFSLGIASPAEIRSKAAEAAHYPIFKLKIGSPHDRENLAALREVAPKTPVRVDVNEGWATKEEALGHIEWLATDAGIQFIEQPLPARNPLSDFAWLKARSPLPILADESYLYARDIDHCAEAFHGVNVKLVKAGGITAACEALRTARRAGLKTMLGCMIESSVLISAAAHLAELTDYLDFDGNMLITNDPFRGVTAVNGRVSFAQAQVQTGLRVNAIGAPLSTTAG